MFGANLVIPAQICDKLSCEQGQVSGILEKSLENSGQTDIAIA